MKIGFIGLGNVGAKLAGCLLRNGLDMMAYDINPDAGADLIAAGAVRAKDSAAVADYADVVITCLPSPAVSAEVVENSLLSHLREGKVWVEMSTTCAEDVQRLGELVRQTGAEAADCPVSGGEHRAATGNISIFAGCARPVFARIFPALKHMGRRILHTGDLGSASTLKVVTNYLATANLAALCEALVVAKVAGVDLHMAYDAIRISSGNSFVHETESQVILNGSRNIKFTMDLVLKDVSLFQAIADRHNIDLELSPMLISILKDGIAQYGAREQSSNIIRRVEDRADVKILAKGFPAEMVDYEPEEYGHEVKSGEWKGII